MTENGILNFSLHITYYDEYDEITDKDKLKDFIGAALSRYGAVEITDFNLDYETEIEVTLKVETTHRYTLACGYYEGSSEFDFILPKDKLKPLLRFGRNPAHVFIMDELFEAA